VGSTGHDSVTRYAHDAHGRLTQTTDPSGHVTSVAYYSTGFHNTDTVTAVNRLTTFRYDRYGRADSTTVPGGAVLTVSLDSLNRTRITRGPNGVHVTYAYDSLSRVRSITDAKGQTYQYSYNPLGWLLTQINADTNHTLSARTDSFFYSAAGLVTKHRDRNALATTMTYDSLGRVLTLTLADGRVTKYSYDPNGLFQADSNAASIDTVRTDFTGLVHTEFTKQAGNSYSVISTLDANGLLQSTVLKSGTTTWDSVSYGYDALFRLNALQTKGGTTAFHYAADGLLTSWKLPTTNSDSTILSYSQTHQPLTLSYSRPSLDSLDELLARDTLDRVVEQSIGPVGSLNDTVRFFAYDSTGRLTTYADSLSADSLICVPDPHGQDGEHCTPSGGWTFVSKSSYTYDSANNRTDLGAVLTPGNRATTFNGYTLTYDNVGNLTHKSKTGFDQYYYWNSIGQLDSVVTNGGQVSFNYDGQGRRVSKGNDTGFELRYIYSGGQLIAEVDSSNTTHAQDMYRYYPGVDNPHSVVEVSGTYYYLSAIGTPGVAAVIDSTGKIRNRYRYNPWGGLEDSVENVSNVLKFAGREYDAETHLYYNRARYYDPQLARFISEDPAGQGGGSNQYAYAGNNPVGATDPSGECWDTNGLYIPEADGSCPHAAGYAISFFGQSDGWWGQMADEIESMQSHTYYGANAVAYLLSLPNVDLVSGAGDGDKSCTAQGVNPLLSDPTDLAYAAYLYQLYQHTVATTGVRREFAIERGWSGTDSHSTPGSETDTDVILGGPYTGGPIARDEVPNNPNWFAVAIHTHLIRSMEPGLSPQDVETAEGTGMYVMAVAPSTLFVVSPTGVKDECSWSHP
jgi:RHS repeat-associated protein